MNFLAPSLPILRPLFKNEVQKKTFFAICLFWLLNTFLSDLYLCKIGNACSSTRLFCIYVSGIIFWYFSIHIVTSIIKKLSFFGLNKLLFFCVLGFLGLLLISVNLILVSSLVKLSYQMLWGFKESNTSWINELITNNVLINLIFYSLVIHISSKEVISQNSKQESLIEIKNSINTDECSKIVIKDKNIVYKVNLADILYVQVIQNCIHIFTHKKRHIVYNSLVKFAENLPADNFIRVHRSIIVNQAKIEEIRNLPTGDAELVLSTGAKVKCSRNYKRSLNLQ